MSILSKIREFIVTKAIPVMRTLPKKASWILVACAVVCVYKICPTTEDAIRLIKAFGNTQTTPIANETVAGLQTRNDNCYRYTGAEAGYYLNPSEWLLEPYEFLEDTKRYRHNSKSLPYPDIHSRFTIPATTATARVEYSVISQQESPNFFIFSLGTPDRIFRIFIAELNPKKIGFVRYENGKEIPRNEEDIRELSYPIKKGSTVTLIMYAHPIGKLTTKYEVTLTYIPAGYQPSNTITDSFSWEVTLTTATPETYRTEIGFGVARGSELKISEYEICPKP